jgi:RNA polymerase sigma-70 factor (ECF subfamily)
VTRRQDLEDADLVRALIARERGAPRLLWRRFAPMVFRILNRALGPPRDVEDLAQEIFLCVFEKVSALREPTALTKFVMSVTMLTVRYEVRRRAMRRWIQPGERADAGEHASVETDTDSREALTRFYRVLDRLNAGDRTIFVLRVIEELPLLQVAETSGLSLATTKRRLARAWSRVRLLVERDPILRDYVSNREAGVDVADDAAPCYSPQPADDTHLRACVRGRR